MKAGTCFHYNGCRDSKSTCRAGVNYVSAFNTPTSPGMFLRMPCVNSLDRKGHAKIDCAMYREPTAQELQDNEREWQEVMQRMDAGLKVAREWRVKPKPKSDRAAVVECPVCKGRLHLSQSAYNGHVHGSCETKDCLRWME